jgi:hypothetical protein
MNKMAASISANNALLLQQDQNPQQDSVATSSLQPNKQKGKQQKSQPCSNVKSDDDARARILGEVEDSVKLFEQRITATFKADMAQVERVLKNAIKKNMETTLRNSSECDNTRMHLQILDALVRTPCKDETNWKSVADGLSKMNSQYVEDTNNRLMIVSAQLIEVQTDQLQLRKELSDTTIALLTQSLSHPAASVLAASSAPAAAYAAKSTSDTTTSNNLRLARFEAELQNMRSTLSHTESKIQMLCSSTGFRMDDMQRSVSEVGLNVAIMMKAVMNDTEMNKLFTDKKLASRVEAISKVLQRKHTASAVADFVGTQSLDYKIAYD